MTYSERTEKIHDRRKVKLSIQHCVTSVANKRYLIEKNYGDTWCCLFCICKVLQIILPTERKVTQC